MKNVLSVSFVLGILLTACSKKEQVSGNVEEVIKPHYDTVAIDSFSPGATSVDIVEQIRKSSKKYQDSIKEVLKLQEQEKKLKEELEKENKKKLEEEREQQKLAEPAASGEIKAE